MFERIINILDQGDHEMMMDMEGFNNMMQTGGMFGVPYMFIGGFLLILVIVLSLYVLFRLTEGVSNPRQTIVITPTSNPTHVATASNQTVPQINATTPQPQIPSTNVCPNCGNVVPPGAHFCPTCGFNLARRQ